MTPPLKVTQFFLGDVIVGTGTPNVVYTVPTGKRIKIAYVHGHNHDGGVTKQLILRFGGLAVQSVVLSAGGNFEWFTWYVLNAGQQIDVRSPTSPGSAVLIAGYTYAV